MGMMWTGESWVYVDDVLVNPPVSETDSSSDTPAESSYVEPTTDIEQKAQDDFEDAEESLLVAECRIFPSPLLLPDQNIRITGLGTYLSGIFYVERSVFKVDANSGFSHEITATRSGFGENMKKGKVITPSPAVVDTTGEVTPVLDVTKHIIVAGDTLGDLAVKYYGDRWQWERIKVANNLTDEQVLNLTIGSELIIPQ